MIDTFNHTKGDDDAEWLLAECDPVIRLTKSDARIFLDQYFLPLQILLGALGNTCSATVLLSPRMKSGATIFLAAICCLDNGILILHFPYAFAIYPTFYRSTAFREFYYDTHVFFQALLNIFAAAVTWLMLGVSLERFIWIRSVRASLSTRRAFVIVAVICLGVTATSFYNFFEHSYHQVFSLGHRSFGPWIEKCFRTWIFKRVQTNNATYVLIWKIVDIFTVILIPVILMFTLNVVLIRKLRTTVPFERSYLLATSEQEIHSTSQYESEDRCARKDEETVVVTSLLSWHLITNSPLLVSFFWDILLYFEYKIILFELLLPNFETRFIYTNIAGSILLWGKTLNFVVFLVVSKSFRRQFHEMLWVRWKTLSNKSMFVDDSSTSQSFNSLPKRQFLGKLCRVLEKRVPITKWLPSYSFRDNFCGDLTGGFTMGIMHVSEGMAYAPLTGLRPVNGLFSSLFPAFIYMFFGTSKHVSIGGFAVICLMVGSTISRVTPQILDPSSNTTNSSMIEKLTYETNVEVAAALTLGIGLAQILMGFCQFDVLTSFLSDQVITGFTTGAAVHVMTSQLDKAIGAQPPRRDGPGKLFWIYSDLFSALLNGHFHFLTASLSAFLIVTLFFIKNFVDPRLRAALRLNTPIPYDLIVMLLGTFFSGFFSLADRHGVAIIGEIPTGLPSAHFPQFPLLSYMLLDSFSIALIILVIHISMGKLFAKKHNYELNVKQEFYATGITECLCSLFPVFPPSTSLGRSLVGEAAGSKTLLTALFSSSTVLSVVLFLGPLFEPLPTFVLSSIVIVSLQGMFRQIGQLPELWRMNRVDALVFLVTLFGTIFVDIVAGLTIGVLFVLATVIYRTQRNALTRVTRMEQSMDISSPQCCLLSLDRSMLSLRLSSSLIFLNVEHFWRMLKGVLNEYPTVAVDPILELDTTTRLLVIDCQLTVDVDIMGARAMCEAVHYSETRGYTVHFCRLNESVLRMLRKLPQFNDTVHAFCERKL